MKYLVIVETNVSDPSWVNEYLEKVTPLVSAFGGRYLTRTSDIELLEGATAPQYSLVAEFPSETAALEFYDSEEYEPYKLNRQSGSESRFLLVPVENGS